MWARLFASIYVWKLRSNLYQILFRSWRHIFPITADCVAPRSLRAMSTMQWCISHSAPAGTPYTMDSSSLGTRRRPRQKQPTSSGRGVSLCTTLQRCHCCGIDMPIVRYRKYDVNYEIQEAQLSPKDRAMRRVSWNLANCHATVQKLLVRQVLNKSKLEG